MSRSFGNTNFKAEIFSNQKKNRQIYVNKKNVRKVSLTYNNTSSYIKSQTIKRKIFNHSKKKFAQTSESQDKAQTRLTVELALKESSSKSAGFIKGGLAIA